MIQRVIDTSCVAPLFAGWEETLIWSCLQGVMGDIYAEATVGESPVSAMAILGDFAFLAGKPDKALVQYRPESHKDSFIIMVGQSEAWEDLIEECYPECAKRVSRYALKKEPEVFDIQHLESLAAALPQGYELAMLEEKQFYECKAQGWSQDLVSQFESYESYRERGLGVVVLWKGTVVAGASSYSVYQDGIEIEIDTLEEHRRKGLATACGARLILECLKRGYYPSWDAQNLWSVALAEKLGYHYSHTYTAYEVYSQL